FGAADWLRRHPRETAAAPPPVQAPATPQWALLPFAAPAKDAELTPLARALEAHLHAWLRGDNAVGIVPRRRVQRAIARIAPDANADTLQRLAPEIAAAASAKHLLRGALSREGQGYTLQLWSDSTAPAAAQIVVAGADAQALFAAYAAQLPAFLAANDV